MFERDQSTAVACSIFPMFFQTSQIIFAICHFVMIFSKTESGSFCNVALHKQPDSAVFLQKAKSGKKQNKYYFFEKTAENCYKQQHCPERDAKTNDFVEKLSYIVGKPKLT